MFRRVRVVGSSMAPTFRGGEVRWCNGLIYRWRAPRKGEVVVVDHPSRRLRMLKRIAAVPGEMIDGRRLGADEYFVVGDNPDASTDSVTFGTVERVHILGRVRETAA